MRKKKYSDKEFKRDCLICNLMLKLVLEVGSFVCICILFSLSKNDPFNEYTIGDPNIYFYDEKSSTNAKMNKSQYENAIINNVSKKVYINNKYKKIPSNNGIKKKLFLRKLISESFCSDIHDDIVKYRGKKFSAIFDLNYDIIFKLSLVCFVISCVLFAFFILFLVFLCISIKMTNGNNCIIGLAGLLSMIIISGMIGKFVLSIILFYYMEKGDAEKYNDFLDCKNVKKKFFEEFSDVNKLRNSFFAFLVINIISKGIDQFEKMFDCLQNFSESSELSQNSSNADPNESINNSSKVEVKN